MTENEGNSHSDMEMEPSSDDAGDRSSQVSEIIKRLPESEKRLLVEELYSEDAFTILVNSLKDDAPELAAMLINEVIEDRKHIREMERLDAAVERENAALEARSSRQQRWFILLAQWFVVVAGISGAGIGYIYTESASFFWGTLAFICVGGPISAQIIAGNTKAKIFLGDDKIQAD